MVCLQCKLDPNFYNTRMELGVPINRLKPRCITTVMGKYLNESDVSKLVVRVFPSSSERHPSSSCRKFDWFMMPDEPTQACVDKVAGKVLKVTEETVQFAEEFGLTCQMPNDGHWMTVEEYKKCYVKSIDTQEKL